MTFVGGYAVRTQPRRTTTMSQRLIKTRYTLSSIPAFFGAEDPPEDENKDEATGGKDTGDSGTGSEGQDADSKDKKPDEKSYTAAEYAALEARMKAADRAQAEAAKKVKEFEDKDKSETERLQGDLDSLTKERDSLAETVKALRFDNAFALGQKHSWHDPAVVLDLVRKRDDVSLEDDGTVKGLDKALDAIAKEKPYLVKNESGSDDPPVSGSGTGSSGRRSDKPDESKVRSKYRI